PSRLRGVLRVCRPPGTRPVRANGPIFRARTL
ncbi:uncharacterized protein METZ01_LOCUS476513, partial [marine metagenome]